MPQADNNSAKGRIKTYSRSSVILTFFLSSYALVLLFQSGSIIWVFLGFALFISIFSMALGVDKLSKLIELPILSNEFRRAIYALTPCCLFASSIYGLYMLIERLPLNDKSLTFIPFIILSLYIAGACIGLFQNPNK